MVMIRDGKLGYVPLVLSLTSSKKPFLVFAEGKDGKKILSFFWKVKRKKTCYKVILTATASLRFVMIT